MAPTTAWTPGVKSLIRDNDRDVCLATSNVLLKISNNILQHPDNPKYRRLRLDNAIVVDKLLPISGAMECLFEMGFTEAEDCLRLPDGADLTPVRKLHEQLLAYKTAAQPATAATAAAAAAAGPSTTAADRGCSSAAARAPAQSAAMFQSQYAFFRKLKSSADHVKVYEDRALQDKAHSVIPVATLLDRAKIRLETADPNAVINTNVLNDMLLLELLSWFKKEFFRWTDKPKCPCGGTTAPGPAVEPNNEERRHWASHIENYRCTTCGSFVRFPRYNHPGRLLETREGRCGEWANCFTLCCRALGLEARYVLDWTDHVWTEVFSVAQDRWLHCDPCENVCDKPLLYDAGWGKKLTYVIAFSLDDIQDVTFRYVRNHQETLARRHDCNEKWLVSTIIKLRNEQQASLPESRRKLLDIRLAKELVELMTEKTTSEQLGGRTTGSLAWRSARGETGSSTPSQSMTIKPTLEEQSCLKVHLQYNPATDRYERPTAGGKSTLGWQNMTHSFSNIARKEESDWNMVYLARTEGSKEASVSWQFSFTDCGLVVSDVVFQALSTRFEDGQVVWRICGDTGCAFLPAGGMRTEIAGVAGSQTLTLSAHLRGGKGDVAWQHTQLFRISMDNKDSYPFDIQITLKKKS